MDIQELLLWIDDLVLAKTGQHFDSVQRTILEGTLQGLKYEDIAKTSYRSKSHIKNVASELWVLLSDILGTKVDKLNARSLLERGIFTNNINTNIVNGNNSKISVGVDCYHSPVKENRSPSCSSTPTTPQKHQDLTDRPHINATIHRPAEISTLTPWIIQDHTNLITLYGVSGIGKTALAIQLIEQIQEHFDYIIWRNLSQFPTYELLENNLIQYFNQQQEIQSLSLLNYLKNHRTLLILDKLETILTPRELTNYYLPNAENYSPFFQEITTANHPSCVLLIGWEKPQQIATLEKKNPTYCRTLPIQGLDATAAEEILMDAQLTGQEKWSELIDLYSGNPFWLNLIATNIHELFDGDVANFLSYPSLYLGDVESISRSHYQRLSSVEKLVITWLANQDTAVTLTRKPATLNCDPADFLKAVQNLIRRCLIEKIIDSKPALFTLLPVIKEYVKNQEND